MIRNLTVLLSLLVVLFAAELRAAEKEETFEPGTGKYLLVLIDGNTAVTDKKTGKKAKEPDVARHGGKVLSKNDRARVIKLPVAAANAMRKEENVAYMQRIWLGESLENWDPQDATAPSAVADTELDSVEEDLTWSTGQFFYDGSGNIKKVGDDTYSYDSAGRLIKAVVNSTAETYKYDSFGNLTEKTTGSAVGQVPVDSSSNRLRGETYDAAGNAITHKGADRFSFDSFNMMDEVDVDAVTARRMLYGPDEERIAVIYDEDLIRWTFRGFDGRVLREYRGNCCDPWEWMEDYVYGEGRLLAGERVPFFRGKRHFHTDHLGTIRLITDQNTRSISRHDFFPFGVEQTDPQYERKNSARADDYHARTDPMKYTAHEREFLGLYNTENTDYLDHMHARMYDPTAGRFLAPDPVLGNLMRPQSWNRYAYVLNNPVNRIDPSGRVACDPGVQDPSSDDCEQVEGTYDPVWGAFRDGRSELTLGTLHDPTGQHRAPTIGDHPADIPHIWHDCVEGIAAPYVVGVSAIGAGVVTAFGGGVLVGQGLAAAGPSYGITLIVTAAGGALIGAGGYAVAWGYDVIGKQHNNLLTRANNMMGRRVLGQVYTPSDFMPPGTFPAWPPPPSGHGPCGG
jgi:RHS repeat-associated protein